MPGARRTRSLACSEESTRAVPESPYGVKAHSPVPVALGFGISSLINHAHAALNIGPHCTLARNLAHPLLQPLAVWYRNHLPRALGPPPVKSDPKD